LTLVGPAMTTNRSTTPRSGRIAFKEAGVTNVGTSLSQPRLDAPETLEGNVLQK
jgi:hypothetical protein